MHNNLHVKRQPNMMLTVQDRHEIRMVRAIRNNFMLTSPSVLKEMFGENYQSNLPETFADPEE